MNFKAQVLRIIPELSTEILEEAARKTSLSWHLEAITVELTKRYIDEAKGLKPQKMSKMMKAINKLAEKQGTVK